MTFLTPGGPGTFKKCMLLLLSNIVKILLEPAGGSKTKQDITWGRVEICIQVESAWQTRRFIKLMEIEAQFWEAWRFCVGLFGCIRIGELDSGAFKRNGTFQLYEFGVMVIRLVWLQLPLVRLLQDSMHRAGGQGVVWESRSLRTDCEELGQAEWQKVKF